MQAGHEVTCGGRGAAPAHPLNGCRHVQVDFARDFDADAWLRRLDGIDLVINAVGAMVARPGQSLEALHTRAPNALFDACARLAIRVINVSALGADASAASTFHLTKKAADDHLLSLQAEAVVLRPSLVYGPGGASARLFNLLASLPVIPLPGDGSQMVQPIHVDDLVSAVVAVAAGANRGHRVIALVGPVPLSLRDFIDGLRRAMGMGGALFLRTPMVMVSMAMRIASRLGAAWASPEALNMLSRGNIADPRPLRDVLGKDPRPVSLFVDRDSANSATSEAKLAWLLVLLRLTIAVVWFAAALVSAGLYPLEDSIALVAKTGVHGGAALGLVYLGVAVDTAFGLGTLLMGDRRLLWIAQMAVIAGYTVIISIWLPEQWLHPFGPVVKNLPLLGAIYCMFELERR
jgi:uncharacterized protein YbjT (DUF2867 family)